MEQPSEIVADEGTAVASEPLSVDFEYTVNWAPILGELGSSLLISTYQAGKVVVVSRAAAAEESGLRISCHNFDKAMGSPSPRIAWRSSPDRWSGSSGTRPPSRPG
jgi:hypothetical protein